MLNQDRREFIGKSLVLAGTAGLLTSGLAGIAHAQTFGPMRRSNRYEDTFIHERKPYSWPDNKSLAVWIAPNVEVWHYDSPVGTGVSPNPSNRVPDVINYAWREYGMRVGLWRLADVLDAAGVKAIVALNSQYLRRPSQGHRRDEEARLGVHGSRHHQQREPRRASLRTRRKRSSATCSRPSRRRPASGRAAGSAPGSPRPTTRSTSWPKRA